MPILDEAQLNAVHQFASTTEAYCALLETHIELADEVFVVRCAEILMLLYRDMLALPEVNTDDLDRSWDEQQIRRGIQFPEGIRGSLDDRFRPKQQEIYWYYFDPFDSSSYLYFPLSWTLWEIYEDVRRGLEFYRLGAEQGLLYAAHHWRGMGLVHWGDHLTDALRVLHEIIKDDWEKRPSTDEDEDEDEAVTDEPLEPIPPEQEYAIGQFARSANVFCKLLEHPDEAMSDAEFIKRCASALLQLYRDALALPESNKLPAFEDKEQVGEKTNPPKNIHEQVYQRFSSRNLDSYSKYFNPFDADSGVTFSVSMDIAEIYEDVYWGLSFYRRGKRQNILQAAWEWQFSFMTHWGPNHSGLLPALFQIISTG